MMLRPNRRYLLISLICYYLGDGRSFTKNLSSCIQNSHDALYICSMKFGKYMMGNAYSLNQQVNNTQLKVQGPAQNVVFL